MAIVTNDNQIEDEVLSELKQKLEVEFYMSSKLKVLFKNIVNAYREDLGLKKKSFTIKQVNVEREFFNETQNLLARSYEEAQVRAYAVLNQDPLVNELISSQELAQINNQVVQEARAYASTRSQTISNEILSTTKNNYTQSRTFVDKLVKEEGLVLTNSEIDSLVMDKFNTTLQNRIPTIATTEVQNVYQATKNIQMNIINTMFVAQGINTQKRWDATLDSDTRRAHAEAHGQRRPINSPFSVWSESLMYPGDTSMGASVKNIVNCRCEQIFILMMLNLI